MRLSDLYRPVNTLSIDVACGAACCSYFFATAFHVPVSWHSLIVLALSVWILYTTDHLLDAKRMGANAITNRHRFHSRYLRPLSVVTVVLTVVDLILVSHLHEVTIRSGVVLGLGAVFYFFLTQRIHWAKEFLAAALYTAGVLIPVFPNLHGTHASGALIFHFYLAALMNLILFSWFDHDRDIHQRSFSFVTHVGKKRAVAMLWLILTAQSALLLWSGFDLFFLLLWIIGGGHMIIYSRRNYFSRMDNFRLAGDALFILPVIVIALS